jgi:hypothetical protein
VVFDRTGDNHIAQSARNRAPRIAIRALSGGEHKDKNVSASRDMLQNITGFSPFISNHGRTAEV